MKRGTFESFHIVIVPRDDVDLFLYNCIQTEDEILLPGHFWANVCTLKGITREQLDVIVEKDYYSEYNKNSDIVIIEVGQRTVDNVIHWRIGIRVNIKIRRGKYKNGLDCGWLMYSGCSTSATIALMKPNGDECYWSYSGTNYQKRAMEFDDLDDKEDVVRESATSAARVALLELPDASKAVVVRQEQLSTMTRMDEWVIRQKAKEEAKKAAREAAERKRQEEKQRSEALRSVFATPYRQEQRQQWEEEMAAQEQRRKDFQKRQWEEQQVRKQQQVKAAKILVDRWSALEFD